MLNLYWKIFLAFWLSSLLIAGGAIWLSHYLPVNRGFRPGPSPQLLLREARQQLRHGQQQAFKSWAASQSKNHDAHFYLFQGRGTPLFQRDRLALTEAELARLQPRARRPRQGFSEHPQRGFNKRLRPGLNERPRRGFKKARRIYFSSAVRADRAGPVHWFIVELPVPKNRFERLLIRSLGLRFLIAFILSGLLCYLLARYFTVPIARLRGAMQQVAAGNYPVPARPRSSTGAPTGTAATTRDELKLLARDFDTMAGKVQQTLANQARLIKDVSHELRSPLARLNAALGLAQQKIARQKTAPLAELEQIEREVQVIDELIEQILSLPQQTISLDDALDLVGLLRHCVDDYRALARSKKLVIHFAADVAEAVLATRGRLLHSAFENIIGNAVHYATPNTAIEVRLEQLPGHYVITVSDRGPGLETEQLAHVFEPFYRASAARERASGGHGLGLAIAQRSVLLHRGSIQASQLHPTGLCIRIELPRPVPGAF